MPGLPACWGRDGFDSPKCRQPHTREAPHTRDPSNQPSQGGEDRYTARPRQEVQRISEASDRQTWQAANNGLASQGSYPVQLRARHGPHGGSESVQGHVLLARLGTSNGHQSGGIPWADVRLLGCLRTRRRYTPTPCGLYIAPHRLRAGGVFTTVVALTTGLYPRTSPSGPGTRNPQTVRRYCVTTPCTASTTAGTRQRSLKSRGPVPAPAHPHLARPPAGIRWAHKPAGGSRGPAHARVHHRHHRPSHLQLHRPLRASPHARRARLNQTDTLG